MKSIGIGVVGTGDVALKLYLPELSSLSPDKARLVAVCDVDPARAERAQAKFGVERVYPSYRELVDAEEVDLVLNLTHHKMHAEVNLAAIESGKSVYSEKPLAITFAEADMLVKKAAERHVTLAAAPAIVLDPLVAMTKKLYDDGELGKMCFARVHGSHEGASLHGRYYDNAWYHKKTEGGGPLFDTGVYALHTVTGVLGPAKASGRVLQPAAARAVCRLRVAGGLRALHDGDRRRRQCRAHARLGRRQLRPGGLIALHACVAGAVGRVLWYRGRRGVRCRRSSA